MFILKTSKFIYNKFFIEEPQPGLKLLFLMRLDIYLFTLPIFIFDNWSSIKKIKQLRKLSIKPLIVYHSMENDGRFQRFNEISENDSRLVVFKYRPSNSDVEKYYFKSYKSVPFGFYEDMRQRYILPNNLSNRKKYREHCKKLLRTLELFSGKINFFCSGSNNDLWIVELIEAAQSLGISWVVCEREGTSTDIGYEMEGEGFKISNSVVAHYHFLANDKHTKMISDAKTSSVKLCKTIGELDTDWWFHYDKQAISEEFKEWDQFEKVILFLTFGERNYIEPTLFPDKKDITWQPLLTDCEEVILNYASQHPKHLILYRMGHKEDKNLVFLNRVKNMGLKNIIESSRSTSLFNNLAIRSDLIIGFQSTAMYEAMFTDKVIIQVFWHIMDFLNPVRDILPIADYGACKVARSKNSFAELLELFAKDELKVSKQELEARKKTREIMFKNADGKMAERFLEEIISISSAEASND